MSRLKAQGNTTSPSARKLLRSTTHQLLSEAFCGCSQQDTADVTPVFPGTGGRVGVDSIPGPCWHGQLRGSVRVAPESPHDVKMNPVILPDADTHCTVEPPCTGPKHGSAHLTAPVSPYDSQNVHNFHSKRHSQQVRVGDKSISDAFYVHKTITQVVRSTVEDYNVRE